MIVTNSGPAAKIAPEQASGQMTASGDWLEAI
jgi:hypothetical protein